MYSTLARVASSPLFHCARMFVQYAAASMALNEYTKSPRSVLPQCATVSICSCPGGSSLHGPLKIGMMDLSAEGFVEERPFLEPRGRSKIHTPRLLTPAPSALKIFL